MTLRQLILDRIRANGPITVAEYMLDCLMHPTYGYYTTRLPFGAQGDFVTAPEVSQMFGELIGLSLAQCWLDQGQPTPFTLCELGPGRGTLMSDILRAASNVQGFIEAARIVLVEASPKMQSLQRETLKPHQVTFLTDVIGLPDQPLFFVANEFFDALPVRQFERQPGLWRERLIGTEGDTLAFGLGPETGFDALAHRLADTRAGDIVEIAPQASPIIERLTELIEAQGGAGLVIDYGDWGSLGNTLQAVLAHEFIDVLERPGQSDLTAHVDFETLARASLSPFAKLTPQGVFLERLGITERARILAKQLQGEALERHIMAHRRLTHPDEMGNLFKVFGVFATGTSPPPGLEI